MDGNGAQLSNCAYSGLFGETAVNVGLMAAGGALGPEAGQADEALEAEPKPTAPGCDECLVGGSAIWMADGTTKSIDQVQVGDQLLSRDLDTGKDGVKTVTGTISRPADTLVTLALVDPSTHKTSTITCTPGHPVYVEGEGWVEAGDLVAGNAIVTRTGSALIVASLQWQRDETGNHPFTVYNLTVEDDHTYFAGDIDGGLWVHNCTISLGGEGETPGAININVPKEYGGVYRKANPQIDIYADMRQLPFASDSVDSVIGNQVPMQNTPEWAGQIANESYRVLKPGGTIKIFSNTGGGAIWDKWLVGAGFQNVLNGYGIK
jgi:hypothetical protein